MNTPPKPPTPRMTPSGGTAAPGLPPKIWFVIWLSGEHSFIRKEPLEGIVAWAKNVDATVTEYTFGAVIHTPPPKKKESLKP